MRTVACMSWIDEPENEERWHEWESMFDGASSNIEALADAFDTNSSHEVLTFADWLTHEVVAIHQASGVPHLAVRPVIDVAGDADLNARWKDAEPYLEDEDDCKESREADVAVEAIAAAAYRFCDVAGGSFGNVAAEVEETGND